MNRHGVMKWIGMLLMAGCSVEPSVTLPDATSIQQESAQPAEGVGTQTTGGGESVDGEITPAASSETASDSDATSLVDLLLSDEDRELLRTGNRQEIMRDRPPEIDDDRVSRSGIRKLEGQYVTIYTDLPARFAVDDLPTVFDAAVPQWCEYFQVPIDKVKDWKMTGYVILSKERHRQAGLLPDNLPNFLHGFQRGLEFWVYEQESDYYRRHLVLHEGVHGFMNAMLGGAGPPWYQEGLAEYLATHRWKDRQLTMRTMPRNREEVPYWGRIKIIRDEFDAGRAMMLREVMRFGSDAHLKIEPYAWSWAAVSFLDNHPVYRNRFRQLTANVADSTAFFTRDFESHFSTRLRELDEEWQLFIVNLDFGYDFVRTRVEYGQGMREPGVEGRSFTLAVDRGWQSTGMRMEAGKTYRILAKGRFLIRQNPEWWCEPGGVTLRYIGDHPIGMLMGNIRLDEPQPGMTNLANPIPIGLNRRIVAAGNGVLYLKINEHPAELADNKIGQVMVKVMEYTGAAENSNRPDETLDEQG